MKSFLPPFHRFLVLVSLVFSAAGWGQDIFSNPITGTNPNISNPYTAGQTADQNITVSGIGRGTGITGINTNDRYNANGWNSAAFDVNDYFEFTLTPNSGYHINFTSFVYTGQASGTGPKSFAFRSSIDGFTANLGSPTATDTTIGLSAAPFQNINSPITFRLYAWGASAEAGTFSVNDFSFKGAVVSSTVKPEPSAFPAGFSCGASTDGSISLSWTDAGGTTPPDGYLIGWSTTSYADIADPTDGTPVASGAGAQNITQGVQAFTATGLLPNTPYYFKIWSYTNSGTNIDYKLAGEPKTVCSTLAPPCNFVEDFSNIPTDTPGSYLNRSWSGTGGTWSATLARTDQILNGKAIATNGSGKVTAPPITGGLGHLSFQYARAFTGGDARTIQVWANGVQVGGTITVSPTSDVPQNYSFDINIPGTVQLELRTSGAQIKIDDLAWTCFSGTPEPNISIQGSGITIASGDITPSAADGTNFGAAIIAGTEVERTFALQNLGSVNLILNDPAVVLLDGNKGFTVSAQPLTNPVEGFAIRTFTIKFSNMLPGTYSDTVKIESNDPDTPAYTFAVQATVSAPLITSDKLSLTGFTYPQGQGPSPTQSFTVNGSSLAGNITVTASEHWEISTNLTYDGANIAPWRVITLEKTAANAVTNRSIHVRLKDGLAEGSYTGGIVLESPSAAAVSIHLNGTVTGPVPEMKITGNGATITNGSITPNSLNNTLFASQNIGESQTKTFHITNSGGAPLTINTLSVSAGDFSSFTILNPPATGTVLNPQQTAAFEIRFAPATVGSKTATISVANSDPLRNPYTFTVQGGATFCASAGDLTIAQQGFETCQATPVLPYNRTDLGTPGAATGFSSGQSGGGDRPKANNLYSEGSRGFRIQGNDSEGIVPSGTVFTFGPTDTSAYTDIKLSFKVAGFSLGSSSNGMDCNGIAGGQTCVPDNEKTDYVLVEVSPDNGATWYPQAKVTAQEMNVAWSFGSNGTTTSAARDYAAHNNLTYFSSGAVQQYSAVTVNHLPAVKNLKVRITAQNNAVNESWILDDIRISSTGLVPKVWNGSAWIPSAPVSSDRAIIDGDYSTAAHGSFKVCQCEVNTGTTLTVSEGTAITVTDGLKNAGHILVESGGGLVQLNDAGANTQTGTFTVERKIKLSTPVLPVTERSQYSFMISPVENFNLKTGGGGIYSGIPSPHVAHYNQTNNYFYTSDGAYVPGRALAVKEPSFATVPAPAAEVKAVFRGIPVNGVTVGGVPLTFSAANSNPGVNTPDTAVRGYNLTGNPYPSNIDLVAFYNLNGGEAGGLGSTFYFWDNTANNTYTQYGSGYSGNAYGQFNAVSLTPVKAAGDDGMTTVKMPSRYVSVAQGFMVRVLNANKTLQFSNSIRRTENAVPFFGKKEGQMDRFWISMVSPANLASQMAVVYFEDGYNSFSADDSRFMGSSDGLYSWAADEKVSINGRSPFVKTDVIPLGSRHHLSGSYTIRLDASEGVFANGQPVYLRDRQTGTVTDLNATAYMFEAGPGEISGRFEIIYTPEPILVTDAAGKEELSVYRDAGDFVVRARTKKITRLELYDSAGRLIATSQPGNNRAVIRGGSLPIGIYFLRIEQNGTVSSRKIRKP